ncbi:MDR family MFS transporter [Amycolatopsis nigrescens]|uniref:MDR family MFS transporter n=1 Tax=Amycolatopsis nigrescens TaxID=381445 RepID=UPI0012F81922|nr:MDR family MFS transporter [Amycolatopsis nigrescens]
MIIFTGLALAMFLASLDQTIIATALPAIAGDLGGLDQLSWIITVYHLASAATTPLWGRASDIYGRKKLFISAILVFLLGSVLSGLAQDIGQLIAFRACQGLGAGGMMTLAMAVIADVVSPRERGRYQGYMQLMFTLASVLGPLLGGLLVDVSSWRWVFYVNIPIGAVALGVIIAKLKLPKTRTERALDYSGAVLLTSGVICLLLVTEWGGRQYSWGSGQILGLLGGALVLLVTFILWERRAAEPILPPRLFRNPVFVVVTITLFLATCMLFAVLMFTPLFLQIVVGSSATSSGLLLLPMTVGITISTVLSGRLIARTGRYRHFPVIGLAIATVVIFLLSRITESTSQLVVMLYMLLFGAGFGLVTQVLVIAVQNGAERQDIGIATASANFFRSLGASIGAAVFGSIFAAGLNSSLAQGGASGVDANAVQSSPAVIQQLPDAVREVVTTGVADSVTTVFLVGAGVAALAWVASLFLRGGTLRGKN